MRLFIAINLPQHIRIDIWNAAQSLREESYPIRWVRPEALHLTVKFLGDVNRDREREVATAVEQAVRDSKRFTMRIGGFGAFPSASRARAVWVGCEAVPGLELMQHRIEQAMEAVGFPVEGRPFRPHLTLGRARRNAGVASLDGLQAQLEELAYDAEVEVRSVDLMESVLGSSSATYTIRLAAEFGE